MEIVHCVQAETAGSGLKSAVCRGEQRRHGVSRLIGQGLASDVGDSVDLVIWITVSDEVDVDNSPTADLLGRGAQHPRGGPTTVGEAPRVFDPRRVRRLPVPENRDDPTPASVSTPSGLATLFRTWTQTQRNSRKGSARCSNHSP